MKRKQTLAQILGFKKPKPALCLFKQICFLPHVQQLVFDALTFPELVRASLVDYETYTHVWSQIRKLHVGPHWNKIQLSKCTQLRHLKGEGSGCVNLSLQSLEWKGNTLRLGEPVRSLSLSEVTSLHYDCWDQLHTLQFQAMEISLCTNILKQARHVTTLVLANMGCTKHQWQELQSCGTQVQSLDLRSMHFQVHGTLNVSLSLKRFRFEESEEHHLIDAVCCIRLCHTQVLEEVRVESSFLEQLECLDQCRTRPHFPSLHSLTWMVDNRHPNCLEEHSTDHLILSAFSFVFENSWSPCLQKNLFF